MTLPARMSAACLAAFLLMPADPAAAYKWPGEAPSPGAALSAKVIGKRCPDILSAAEITELDAYLARAAAELSRSDQEQAAKDTSYRPLSFDAFAVALTADYERKYADGKACAGASEEARDSLQRVRKAMASAAPLYPAESDPNRLPYTSEVIGAAILGERCEDTLSALEVAELRLYLARVHLHFARSSADGDARIAVGADRLAEAAIAKSFRVSKDCRSDAVAKARSVVALVRRNAAAQAE